MTGPTDPRRRAAWQAARRAAARRHHPDLGGDTDSYLAALAEVDRQFDPAPVSAVPSSPGRWVQVRRAVNRQRRRSRTRVRELRQKLPRRMPGAKRYIDLT